MGRRGPVPAASPQYIPIPVIHTAPQILIHITLHTGMDFIISRAKRPQTAHLLGRVDHVIPNTHHLSKGRSKSIPPHPSKSPKYSNTINCPYQLMKRTKRYTNQIPILHNTLKKISSSKLSIPFTASSIRSDIKSTKTFVIFSTIYEFSEKSTSS